MFYSKFKSWHKAESTSGIDLVSRVNHRQIKPSSSERKERQFSSLGVPDHYVKVMILAACILNWSIFMSGGGKISIIQMWTSWILHSRRSSCLQGITFSQAISPFVNLVGFILLRVDLSGSFLRAWPSLQFWHSVFRPPFVAWSACSFYLSVLKWQGLYSIRDYEQRTVSRYAHNLKSISA